MRLKVTTPLQSDVFVRKGDNLKNVILYESEAYEVIEEVELTKSIEEYKFFVKNGQFVTRGEKLFSEGFINQKIMISDVSGIVEIENNFLRILGHKSKLTRKVNLIGFVDKIVPGKFIELVLEPRQINTSYYRSSSSRINTLIDFQSLSSHRSNKFSQDIKIKGYSTLIFNQTVNVQDLAKSYALGYRRIIVDSLSMDSPDQTIKELNKFDAVAVLQGFGNLKYPLYNFYEGFKHDVFWGKSRIYFFDRFEKKGERIFEHPFWGLPIKINKKDNAYSEVSYDNEDFTVYNKNIS